MARYLKLKLIKSSAQNPVEMERIHFVTDDGLLRTGSFAGNTFFSEGQYFRPQQVLMWTAIPKRLPVSAT